MAFTVQFFTSLSMLQTLIALPLVALAEYLMYLLSSTLCNALVTSSREKHIMSALLFAVLGITYFVLLIYGGNVL